MVELGNVNARVRTRKSRAALRDSVQNSEASERRSRSIFADVAEGVEEDIGKAVGEARKAFENGLWPKTTLSERGRLIWKLADMIEQHFETFARAETLDNYRAQ